MDNKGVALILVILMITIMLFLGMFFLNSSLTEKAIAKSQATGVNSYYLAESGINEMVYLIVNDPVYETNFIYNDGWTDTFTRDNPFGPGSGSYTVTASNTSAAHCDIIATGRYEVSSGKYAQRVIKTDIFRAIGTSSSPLLDSAGYADGNITITNSYIKFLEGSPHSNNTFDVNNQNVEMFVEHDVRATGNYLEHANASTTIIDWIYADNYLNYAQGTGTAPHIDMPAVDFNSAAPSSYKNMALSFGTYMTASQFDDLICTKISNSEMLVLTKKITYIEGNVELNGPIYLKNPNEFGVLVINGKLNIGTKEYKTCGGIKKYGRPDILFTYGPGNPSGILASAAVQILDDTGHINVQGVLYSNAEMTIKNLSEVSTESTFYIRGGAIAQKLDIDGCYGWPTIVHDSDIIFYTLVPAISSPTIIVEHWEEEY